jgi:hypothetical protein
VVSDGRVGEFEKASVCAQKLLCSSEHFLKRRRGSAVRLDTLRVRSGDNCMLGAQSNECGLTIQLSYAGSAALAVASGLACYYVIRCGFRSLSKEVYQ